MITQNDTSPLRNIDLGYLFLRLIVNAVGIALVAWLLPGIHVVDNNPGTYLLIALVFGAVNMVLKPIITLLTCSLVVFTLGLFLLVINGFMLWLTAQILPGLIFIDSFWWAVGGGVIVSLLNMVLDSVTGRNDDGRGAQVKVMRFPPDEV